MRVLVVEDDPMIGRAVLTGLRDSGYATDWVRDGVEAELALSNGGYDAALLDLGLPRREGMEILKSLRRGNEDLPVLIITARDALSDRIAGLDSGADDYLVKPFSLEELLARMRAVIRRRVGRASPEICYGALVVDPARRRVTFRGRAVELSAREFAVLEALFFAVRAYDKSGRVYFETVLPSMPDKVPMAREAGFTYAETDDGRWRVFTNVSPQGIVQVGQPVEMRAALARDLSWRVVTPLLVFLPLL